MGDYNDFNALPLPGHVHLGGSNEHGTFGGDGRFVAIRAENDGAAIDCLLAIDAPRPTPAPRRWWTRVGDRVRELLGALRAQHTED